MHSLQRYPPFPGAPLAQPSSGAVGLGRGLRPICARSSPVLFLPLVSRCSEVHVTGCAGLKPQRAQGALV